MHVIQPQRTLTSSNAQQGVGFLSMPGIALEVAFLNKLVWTHFPQNTHTRQTFPFKNNNQLEAFKIQMTETW